MSSFSSTTTGFSSRMALCPKEWEWDTWEWDTWEWDTW
jgi:hypothetical protein